MKTSFIFLSSTLVTLFFVACTGNQKEANETTPTENELDNQSIELFNGTNLTGW